MVRYLIQIGLLFALAISFVASDVLWYKGLCLWAIGLFVGAIARDFGWLLVIRRQWPFTQKIINWRYVEAIAEGRAAGSLQGGQIENAILLD